MQKLLRQTTSGHIYVWTPQLAERSDMEPYVRETVVEKVVAQENTSENPSNTSAEVKPADPLEDAKAAFRRQVVKAARKPAKATSGAT